jgi:ATP-binding cassette subfamily B protein
MWNRQREAEEARERLARAADDERAPNRNPPAIGEPLAKPAEVEPAAAAE